MSRRFKVKSLTAAVALSFMAAGVSASPIDLTYMGTTATSPKAVDFESTPVTPRYDPAGAFGFRMRTDANDAMTEFLAWCLDIGSALGTNGAFEYIITKTPFTNSEGLDNDQMTRVQSVFDANYGTLDDTNGIEAAGFQVALWNALYDDDEVAGAGTFSISSSYGSGSSIIAKANGFLEDAFDYTGDKMFNLTFYESTETDPQRQNLVSAAPVPLPAAGFLFLGALGGLAALRRRKKAS